MKLELTFLATALLATALLAATGCSDDSSSGACPPTAVQELCVATSSPCCPATIQDSDRPVCKDQVWTCPAGRTLGPCFPGKGSLPTCGAPADGGQDRGSADRSRSG